MRIAISGSHCVGKSTLIELFLKRHPEYKHESEAYEVIDVVQSAEPSGEEFFNQLECHLRQIEKYRPGDDVIIERSSIDYLAYIKGLMLLNRDACAGRLFNAGVALVKDSLMCVDLIMFLSTRNLPTVTDDEDPSLRQVVNELLEELLLNDDLDLISDRVRVVEASGSTEQRLLTLEEVLQSA
jgi:hypothetical protein